MTAAAITDHDNKEHNILSTLHMSQQARTYNHYSLIIPFHKFRKILKAIEKHETYLDGHAILELKELYST